MKWTSSQPGEYQRIGTVRQREIFALIPHRCEDGKTRWLERVVVSETLNYHPFLEGWSWWDKQEFYPLPEERST